MTSNFALPSCFTDAFVNSQEWTLSRSVPELKVVSGSTGLGRCHSSPAGVEAGASVRGRV